MPYNKYRAVKTTIDGVTFDSRMESRRYRELCLLLDAGEISHLTLQPRFILLEGFTDNQGIKERPVHYTGDFQYIENNLTIVEDVKSEQTRKTRDYQIRRKLFKKRYPDIIYREVEA